MYVASFLDRVNIGFAALTMNQDLGFSPEVFGFGAGIFFFGYFLFEVPSNLMLEKVGARVWMCRIMVSWGLVSMATRLRAGTDIFLCRCAFCWALAEAGLYPGMILYMTYWFPQATRARFIALFLAAVPAASVIGAPISGWLLGFDGLPAWLAMDAPAGRHSLAAAGRGGAVAAARPAGQGAMAERRGQSDPAAAPGRRPAERCQGDALHGFLGNAGRQAHLDFHHSGFLHRDRALRHGPVDAADDQGAGLLQSSRPDFWWRCPMSSA